MPRATIADCAAGDCAGRPAGDPSELFLRRSRSAWAVRSGGPQASGAGLLCPTVGRTAGARANSRDWLGSIGWCCTTANGTIPATTAPGDCPALRRLAPKLDFRLGRGPHRTRSLSRTIPARADPPRSAPHSGLPRTSARRQREMLALLDDLRLLRTGRSRCRSVRRGSSRRRFRLNHIPLGFAQDRGLAAQEIARKGAGQGLEIADEVRLVGIAAFERQFGPRCARVQILCDGLPGRSGKSAHSVWD